MRNTLHTIFSSVALWALLPARSFAAWTPTVKLAPPVPGAGTTMSEFIYLLISIVQLIGIPLLVMCLIYSGYLMVTSAGNETQVSKAKMWIFWTIIGALIVLGAKPIADMVYGTASAF